MPVEGGAVLGAQRSGRQAEHFRLPLARWQIESVVNSEATSPGARPPEPGERGLVPGRLMHGAEEI